MLSPVHMAPCLWDPAKNERVRTNGRTSGHEILDTSLYCDPGRQDSLSAAATPEVLAFGARTSCPSTVACSQKVVAQRVHPNSLTATGHVMIEAIHLGCRTPVTAMLLWVPWPHDVSGSCIVNIAVFHLRCRSGMLTGSSLQPPESAHRNQGLVILLAALVQVVAWPEVNLR